MVTSTRASVPARPSCRPRPTSQAANGRERVLAPNAAEKNPARVTPTWTAARKRLGSLSRRCTALPRRPPFSPIARTWDSRSETSAISAPEKAPPIRTKTTTITMLSQTSLTGGVLLSKGAVGRRPCCPLVPPRAPLERGRPAHSDLDHCPLPITLRVRLLSPEYRFVI